MKKCYFLGANSKNGFHSLYSQFPPDKDSKLHIIKAGPGTGKSTFMRKIGQAAEQKGLDAEYILCSGDPDSLDGVYIPDLGEAWVDGTAPHVTEPDLFGVNSDYINLGKYLKKPFSGAKAEKIRALNKEYKLLYEKAYCYLAAAAKLHSACLPDLFNDTALCGIRRRVSGIINRNLGHGSGEHGKIQYRFISAVSCFGDYRLNCQIEKSYKLKYQFDSACHALDYALSFAAQEAVKRGADIIICPSPLDPEEIEAVLIPSHGIALLGSDWEFENAKSVHIDNLADVKLLQSSRAEIREGKKLEKKTMELAYNKLRSAKALHDQLEDIYKSHMDFSALSKYTDSYLKRLLELQ